MTGAAQHFRQPFLGGRPPPSLSGADHDRECGFSTDISVSRRSAAKYNERRVTGLWLAMTESDAVPSSTQAGFRADSGKALPAAPIKVIFPPKTVRQGASLFQSREGRLDGRNTTRFYRTQILPAARLSRTPVSGIKNFFKCE